MNLGTYLDMNEKLLNETISTEELDTYAKENGFKSWLEIRKRLSKLNIDFSTHENIIFSTIDKRSELPAPVETEEIVVISASKLMMDLMEHIVENRIHDFRKKYNKLRSLTIFNVEDLIKKIGSTRELRNFLNSTSGNIHLISIYKKERLIEMSASNEILLSLLH